MIKKFRALAPAIQALPFVSILLAFTIGCLLPACASNRPGAGFHETFVSPDIKCHQGYATDGTNHYTFDNQTIYKWRNDLNWSLIASNNTPFAGVPGLNHFGDGDYFQGKLYIVAENWHG
jgi:hypothetical protein